MAVGDSIGGSQFKAEVSEEVGVEAPWWYDTLEGLPGIAESAGLTGLRGSNTIIKGGNKSTKSGRARRRIEIGHRYIGFGDRPVGGAIRNNNPFNPRNWTRYGSQDAFFNDGSRGKYTPFQFLSRGGNWLARQGTFDDFMGKHGIMPGDGQEAFSKGSYARISAGLRVGRMSEGRFNRLSQRGGGFSKFLTKEYGESMANAFVTRGGQRGTQAALMASGKGTISQFAGGFLHGVGGGLDVADAHRLNNAGKQSFVKGAGLASRWAAETGIESGTRYGIRGAAKHIVGQGMNKGAVKAAAVFGGKALGMVIPGLNVIMAASLVYDIAKLGGSLIKGTIKTAADAARSFQGGSVKSIINATYKDTEAAATARARGVMAIQNSQLNARSILGSEAASMHQRFG